MDPLFLRYYHRELQFIREMGAEFAKEFPKIAGRLGLEEFECADPYVERLLEGFAFLAARVQLKLDAEFPQFTQHLLEIVYPHYLAPTPSMAVVQFQPDLAAGSLAEGFAVPRGTALRSLLGKGDQTACEYRTADEVVLWPLELISADYSSRDSAVVSLPAAARAGVRAVLRLRLRTTAGIKFRELNLDRLRFFIRGSEERSLRVFEQIHGDGLGFLVRRPGDEKWLRHADKSRIGRVGFEDHEALLPHGPRSFHGYRLLQEYFAFHPRFMFFELSGLADAVRQHDGHELEIVLLLKRVEPTLDHLLDVSNFALFCGSAINLFPHRADRIHLDQKDIEFHIVPDRTRPLDLEVHQVTAVTGYGATAETRQTFRPFYAVSDAGEADFGGEQAYYTVRRAPRLMSQKLQGAGPRASYFGSELFLSLVDGRVAPYRHDLRQLEIQTLCTNRDLPLHMPVGKLHTDFTLETGAPVNAIRCVAGPTPPKPPLAGGKGDAVWRLISHLSLNYLSLVDADSANQPTGQTGSAGQAGGGKPDAAARDRGAAALRDLLKLYAHIDESARRKQIEGVRSIASRPIVRRLPRSGPMTFGRGIEITVTCEEAAFEGFGVFLLGAVLADFFAKYVSVNSFTETVLRSTERGEIFRWTPTIGRRHVV